MVSNRRMAMVGFIEHGVFAFGFLALFIFIGLPFAMKDSTHWGISFVIYFLTFGNLMYISASLSAYGKSMLTDSNFDVDIGEMYDILSNAKMFKIIFMVMPLAVIGAILSPLALIMMLLNLKTFFKKNEEYLEQIDEEWERREAVWNAETEQMDKKSKEKAVQKRKQRELEKEEFKKREDDRREQEKIDLQEKEQKKSEVNKEEKVKVEKKEVGFIRFTTGGWDKKVVTQIYYDGKEYICYMGKWRRERRASSFNEIVNDFRNFHKQNNQFEIHEIKEY